MKTKTKILAAAAAGALALGLGIPAADAKGRPASTPDVSCMQSGIATLKGAGLLSTVARDGLPIADAVALGVTVREGADISGVTDPIPLNVVLADHRAGDNSLFVYPWC